ncbi:MAG: hypothetical protein QNI96_05255 [Woeseiaceae bacterium]|nr:hypothetical protein [Woeseiaceae bacterium]
MAAITVSLQALHEAAALAKDPETEDAILRRLLEDAGRPLPPKEPPAAGQAFGTYHGTNAAVEGADAETTEPTTVDDADAAAEASADDTPDT